MEIPVTMPRTEGEARLQILQGTLQIVTACMALMIARILRRNASVVVPTAQPEETD